jgi:hypothetical protein
MAAQKPADPILSVKREDPAMEKKYLSWLVHHK